MDDATLSVLVFMHLLFSGKKDGYSDRRRDDEILVRLPNRRVVIQARPKSHFESRKKVAQDRRRPSESMSERRPGLIWRWQK